MIESQHYKKNEHLAKLLDGKRIVIVGPSPHLIGTNSGRKIESYDLVCRPNHKLPIPPHREQDYGKRTDILITNFNSKWREFLIKTIESEYMKNVKHVVIPKTSLGRGINKDIFSEINKYNIPYHLAGDEWYVELNKRVGMGTVNVGLAAIIILLNYDIKELHVTGFSFYNMAKGGQLGGKDIFYPEFADHLIRDLERNKDHVAYHDQPLQIKYFIKLFEKYEVITLDPYLFEHFFDKPDIIHKIFCNFIENVRSNAQEIPFLIGGEDECYVSYKFVKKLFEGKL